MLLKIHTGRVENINFKQRDIIYIVTSVEMISSSDCKFVFTDRHAYQSYAGFYNKTEDLVNLDWNTIKSKNWANSEYDNDKMSRKQAEFLVYKFLPTKCIIGIGVYNDFTFDKVESILKNNNSNIKVIIKKDWYY